MPELNENILIIAGEKSGEEHAASFLPQLKEKHPEFKFFGVGGDYFKQSDVELLYNIREFSAMGFSDVIGKIFFYIKARRKLLTEVNKRNCKIAILIDFQTFNLSLAKKLHHQGVKVFYYVAPQAWIWKAWRAEVIGKCVEHLFCILPFEEKWFRQRGVSKISTLKHPLVSKVRTKNTEDKTILFLPGSRESEVKFLLKKFSHIAGVMKQRGYKCLLVQTKSVPSKYYKMFNDNFDEVFDSTQIDAAFSKSAFAIAASGTVTLDCGLWQIPTIVCYEISLFNEWVVDSFIPYKGYVSLVNLILEEEVFPELIREKCSIPLILDKLKTMIEDSSSIRIKLDELNSKLDSFPENAHEIISSRLSR